MPQNIYKNLENIFLTIGLTKDHANIYSEILQSEELTASDIYKKTEIKRSTVYDYLEKLKSLDLISEKKKTRPSKYIASPYQNLIDLLESDLSDKNSALTRAKSIQKDLKENKPSIKTIESSNQEITHKEAMKIIESKSPEKIFIVNNYEKNDEGSLLELIANYSKGSKTHIYEVISQKPSSKLYISKYSHPNVHMLLIASSSKEKKTQLNKYIFNNFVIYSWENKNRCILINNEEIYKLELIEFEKIWSFYSKE